MNLSVLRPRLSCLQRTPRGNGVRGRKQHASELLGGPGALLPFCVAARHAGLGVQPQARECGSAGGRERLSRPPPPFGDRDDAWMLQGVRELGALCVCAHGLLAGVGLEQGMELDREQEQIGAGG